MIREAKTTRLKEIPNALRLLDKCSRLFHYAWTIEWGADQAGQPTFSWHRLSPQADVPRGDGDEREEQGHVRQLDGRGEGRASEGGGLLVMEGISPGSGEESVIGSGILSSSDVSGRRSNLALTR